MNTQQMLLVASSRWNRCLSINVRMCQNALAASYSGSSALCRASADTSRRSCCVHLHASATSLLKYSARSPHLYSATHRNFSTSFSSRSDSLMEKSMVDSVPYIPSPLPVPADIASSSVNEVLQPMLNKLGEPTLASIGLGNNWPPGLMQQLLEFIHVSCDVPWWGAIAIVTLVIRLMVFPLVINAQKNAAHMTNNMPQMQVIQMKLTDARQTGNYMDSARYAHELMEFMKEKKISPLKNMMVPLAQAPIFVSVFLGLRRMANYPVDSMTTGGMLWFTDLTVPDPFYALPLITCCTMYLTIKMGAEGTALANQQAAMVRTVLKFMPVVLFPLIINFPGAILVYWVSTNFISLAQVSFLRIPRVRTYFKIPKTASYSPDVLPMKQKGFSEGLKESWSNMKVAKQLSDRQRMDDLKFRDAGTGPLVKTFKYNPTEQKVGDSGVKTRPS